MSLLRTSIMRQLRTANSARLSVRNTQFLLQSGNGQAAFFSSSTGCQSKVEIKIEPLPRPGEKLETKRARLLYQSRKRGILETDLLLSKFAQLYLAEMTMEELEEYDKLLDEQDWDIYYWITKNDDIKPCPERWSNSPLMKKLREMVETKGNECTRMPDLY